MKNQNFTNFWLMGSKKKFDLCFTNHKPLIPTMMAVKKCFFFFSGKSGLVGSRVAKPFFLSLTQPGPSIWPQKAQIRNSLE